MTTKPTPEQAQRAKNWHQELFKDSCFNGENEEIFNTIQTALAALASTPEPVAWQAFNPLTGAWSRTYHYENQADQLVADGYKVRPLYAEPPCPTLKISDPAKEEPCPDCGWRSGFAPEFWEKAMAIHQKSACKGKQGATAGPPANDAVQAIEFSITIDDHYDRLAFLEGWIHGDTDQWPKFEIYKNQKGQGNDQD